MGETIAVIDVGKTNAKLALVDAATLAEVAVETRPNTVIAGPPWPHFDLDGHWTFFLNALARLSPRFDIAGIAITTHGAAGVLLDTGGELAAPMLDYEHDGPDALARDYDALRPPFAETGSPRLPMGLNLGAQFHWMFAEDPRLRDRAAHVVTYPQFWAHRLTGVLATEVTSLGAHTDLWRPREGRFSRLVDRLGIADKLPPPRASIEILGTLLPSVAARTGLPAATPVTCGIHDSNASLYPYLVRRDPPFSVVSTGTWVIAMAVGGAAPPLDPTRDTLLNVAADGRPVPSARFMGGREFDLILEGRRARPTEADRAAVLSGPRLLLPAVEPSAGPFMGRPHRWDGTARTEGERRLALSYYLALMTDLCLDLIGAVGQTIVEGPFTQNGDYLEMLTALRPGGVLEAPSATGTSAGCAMLLRPDAAFPEPRPVATDRGEALRAYAGAWRRAVDA